MKTLTWKFAHNQGKPAPVLTLETLAETLAYIKNPPVLEGMGKWEVCSIPLMDFMDELEKTGCVYNTQALRAFEKAHGLPESPENGSELSRLVYNCQGYRRARQLELDGWEPVTPELLEHAMQAKKRVHVAGTTMFGSPVKEGFAVRIWKQTGKPAAFRPKKHMPVKIGGMPCKLSD